MDNNQNAAHTLANIFANTQQFVKQVQSGEGFGIPADKLEEYQKEIEKAGVPAMLKDLENKINEAKESIKKANHANH